MSKTIKMNKCDEASDQRLGEQDEQEHEQRHLQSSAKQVTFALATAGCLSTIHEGRLE